jgi:hypothetical protein
MMARSKRSDALDFSDLQIEKSEPKRCARTKLSVRMNGEQFRNTCTKSAEHRGACLYITQIKT